MASSINILNSSSLHARDIEVIIAAVRDTFGVRPSLAANALDLQRAYDNSRRQYNSTALLAQILASAGTEKCIALVDVDLFIPVLTFVFGEAQLDGRAAVVSTHRLSNTFYGLEEDRILLLHRIEKEIIHELCHTFGMYHCRQFECVMRSSTYVEEIDVKKAAPCNACREVLEQKLGHDLHASP